jgi:hypothetical protein
VYGEGGQGRKVAEVATLRPMLKESDRFGCTELKNSQPFLEVARWSEVERTSSGAIRDACERSV